EDRAHARLRGAARDVQSELRVGRAGRKVRVRVHVHARAEPQQDRLPHAAFVREPPERGDLVEIVDHDPSHALVERVRELGLGLAVAVQVHALAGEAGARGDMQLAPGNDVEAETLLREEREEPGRDVRLRRVADRRGPGIARAQRLAEGAGAREDGRHVVHVEGRAVLGGERDEIASADGEPVLERDARRVGEEVGGERHKSDAMTDLASVMSAASSSPTTEAFTPRSALCAHDRVRSAPHEGSAANTRRNAGRKIAIVAMSAPAMPFGGHGPKRSPPSEGAGSSAPGYGAMRAPRYAAKVNSGPGTACAAPYPARNSSSVTHPGGTTSACSSGRTTWPPPNTSAPER